MSEFQRANLSRLALDERFASAATLHEASRFLDDVGKRCFRIDRCFQHFFRTLVIERVRSEMQVNIAEATRDVTFPILGFHSEIPFLPNVLSQTRRGASAPRSCL